MKRQPHMTANCIIRVAQSWWHWPTGDSVCLCWWINIISRVSASRQLTTNRCSQTSAFQLSWRSQNREVVGLTWLFISRGKLTEDFFPGNHFLAGIKAALHLTRLNLSNMWCLYCPMKKHSNTTLTDTVYMKHEMWNTLHLQPLAPLYMKSTVSGYITGFYRFIHIY